MKIASCLLLLLLQLGYSQTQGVVWTFESFPNRWSSLESAGDINQDGVGDLLVANGEFRGSQGLHSGRVWALSGVDGEILNVYDGPHVRAFLGHVLAGGHDITGDGVPDLIAGSAAAEPTSPSSCRNEGAVYVFDGASAALLYSYTGGACDLRLGRAVDFIADRDADGVDDFIITQVSEASLGCSGTSDAFVYSGATGQLISSQSWSSGLFGSDVAGIADSDGDGLGDILLSGTGDNCINPNPGGHLVYESLWASALGINVGPAGLASRRVVADLGDVDGDGTPDYGVTTTVDSNLPAPHGRVTIYSGTGGIINTVLGTNGRKLGNALSALGDVDGDGFADFGLRDESYALTVYSGQSGTLLRTAVPAWTDFVANAGARVDDLDGDGSDEYAYLRGNELLVYGSAPATPARELVIISGDGQLAGFNSTYSMPLVAELRDAATGLPLAGVSVWVSARGVSVQTGANVTDAAGQISVPATAGSEAGIAQVFVEAAGAPRITYSLSVDRNRQLTIVSGDGQTTSVNDPFALTLVAELTDTTTGVALAGVPATMTAQGVSVSGSLMTDASGRLVLSATAGALPGPATVLDRGCGYGARSVSADGGSLLPARSDFRRRSERAGR